MLKHQDNKPSRNFVTESTTVWHPEVDVAIDGRVFNFTPPA
jgi:hypothetical protein